MKLNTKKQVATHCLEELGKLRHLLSVLCQATNYNNFDPEDIEGSLGIAWDIANSAYCVIGKQTSLRGGVAPLYAPFDGGLPLGDRIQLARENLGLTEADLARALNTYSDHISDWECGLTEPPAGMVIPLVNALKCDLHWLLTGDGRPVPAENNQAESTCKSETLGDRIKSMREAWNLGQSLLASSIGVTRSCVEAWEENATIPGCDKILPLANALSCDPLWLL
ncbi:hypothetical protein CYD30_25105, partial [Kosakonia cowanii]